MHPRPILIVDSDPDSLNIYSLVLQHHGFLVFSAADAWEGWVIAMREQPQLIFTELFLPQLDGESFLELLQNDDRTASIPVVAITSIPRAETAVEVFGSGYVGYLLKPCTPSRLLEEVRQVLAAPSDQLEELTASA